MMSMELGQQISLWCIRLALVFWFAFALSNSRHREPGPSHRSRLLWTLATLFMVAHVILAFAYVHDFSHRQAYEHTAKRTAEMTSWRWGGGIYFNYLFIGLCLTETIWMWVTPATHAKRPQWASIVIYGFLVLIVVNGAIVFAQGYVRWLSVGAVLVWLLLGLKPALGSGRQPS